MRPPDYTPTEPRMASQPDPVEREEAAAFGAFMGAHSSLAAKVTGR